MPYSVDKELPGLKLIPPVMKEDRDRRTRWLGDYSYSNLNCETLPIAALFAMKYCQVLEQLIREVVIADPALGPVYILKADASDSFYPIGLCPTYANKLEIVFP